MRPCLAALRGRHAGSVCCGCEGLHLVGVDLREEMDDGLSRGQAVGDDELVDVLGVRGGVGDDEEAAERVAAEIDLVEVKMLADGVEIGDLGVHGLRGVGIGEW